MRQPTRWTGENELIPERDVAAVPDTKARVAFQTRQLVAPTEKLALGTSLPTAACSNCLRTARGYTPADLPFVLIHTLKRNENGGVRRLLVVAGEGRKKPSDLRKRYLETVERRGRSSVSAGLLADCLRTAGSR